MSSFEIISSALSNIGVFTIAGAILFTRISCALNSCASTFTNDSIIRVFVSSSNSAILDKIIFTNIEQKVETTNYCYKIGEINVGELKAILDSDLRKHVFVANI